MQDFEFGFDTGNPTNSIEQGLDDLSLFFGSGKPCDAIAEYVQEFKNHCIHAVNEIVPTIEWTPEMKTYSYLLSEIGAKTKPTRLDNMIMYGQEELPQFTRGRRSAEGRRHNNQDGDRDDDEKDRLEKQLDALRFTRVPCCCHSPWSHGYVDNAILSSFLVRLVYFKIHFDIQVTSISLRAHFTAPHLAEVMPAPLVPGGRPYLPEDWIISSENIYEHHRLAEKLWERRGAAFDVASANEEEIQRKFDMDEEIMAMDGGEPMHNRPPFSFVWKEDCEQRLEAAFSREREKDPAQSAQGTLGDLDFENKRARNECHDARRMMSATKYIYPIAVFTLHDAKIERAPRSLMHLAAIASAEALMESVLGSDMTEEEIREVIESVPDFVVKYMYVRIVFHHLFIRDRWKTEEELKKERFSSFSSSSQTRKRARDMTDMTQNMLMCSLQSSTFSNFTVQRWSNLLQLQQN